MGTPVVVDIQDLVKTYKVGKIEVPALRGINLKIKKGEFLAVVGPSGSGKSTLLHLIGALDKPTRGKVYIEGLDLSKLSDNKLAELRNRKIGFVFQAFNLIPRLTVLENVQLPLIPMGVPKNERIKRSLSLLEKVGLAHRVHHKPNEISGGEQQRVAIARALVTSPSIVLADEPTGNLDSKTGMSIISLMRKLNKEHGTTLVVVTHNLSVAKLADRIIYLKDGVVEREEILRHD